MTDEEELRLISDLQKLTDEVRTLYVDTLLMLDATVAHRDAQHTTVKSAICLLCTT